MEESLAYIERGYNVCITGGAGTGKTYFINFFVPYYRKKYPKKNIAITSMTGSSALLINGTTLHSYLGIGIEKTKEEMMKRIRKTNKKKKWIEVDILIIDEISMLSKELFNNIHYIAQDLRQNPRPFGGIQIILSGDFCQLGCIDSDFFCFESDFWEKFIHKTCIFTKIYRQIEDQEYANMLYQIRFGIITEEIKDALNQRIQSYPKENDIQPTLLFPYRKNVDEINNEHLSNLINNEKQTSMDFPVKTSDMTKFNKLVQNHSEYLRLCKNAQIILTVNLDIEAGLVNGSRGIVIDFVDNLPLVRFMNGITTIIKYYKFEIEQDTKSNKFSYEHIPLILGWAITIHKSQGMTLDCIETDLSNVFDFGQTYVTLSRIKSLNDLWLHDINFNKIRCNPKVIDFYNKYTNNT